MAQTYNGVVTVPGAVGELGRPWRSLVGLVPHLTHDLEMEFRFGQEVTLFQGVYRLGGNIKGGSSSIWVLSNEREYEAYVGWRKYDGIPREENFAAYDRLRKFLDRCGVTLSSGSWYSAPARAQTCVPHLGYVYEVTHEVLSLLPPLHLERPEFSGLQLGGWGPDCAKGSAYDDGCVKMYDFALSGAKRTYIGLLLHEVGHAHEAALDSDRSGQLGKAFETIAQAGRVLGVEFLVTPESRRIYQLQFFGEFLAETYMIYVSQGDRLRRFIGDSEPSVRRAWQETYQIFHDSFEGREYQDREPVHAESAGPSDSL